jgi:hypothetical protein
MRRCVIVLLLMLFIWSCYNTSAFSQTGSGGPLKYIASCELDLNVDGEPDVVLLVETLKGRELIALLRSEKGYKAFLLSKEVQYVHLSCRFGKSIKETSAGKGEKRGRIFKTPGTYIQLGHPEGPSFAYFWNGRGFQEVWTSD